MAKNEFLIAIGFQARVCELAKLYCLRPEISVRFESEGCFEK